MTETDLQQLFQLLLSDKFPGKKYPIRVAYSNAKTLRHTIELKNGSIYIRISRLLNSAPERVYKALGMILYLKLFRYKVDKSFRQEYSTFADQHIHPHIKQPARRISPNYKAKGVCFDLEEIFIRMNNHYFNNQIKMPILGWSLKKSYTRLGFYDSSRNLLVISRIFDSKKADPMVVDFLMYHEMLHIFFPVQQKNGRRRVHTAEFKRMESQFPQFEKIQKWIKKKRLRL